MLFLKLVFGIIGKEQQAKVGVSAFDVDNVH